MKTAPHTAPTTAWIPTSRRSRLWVWNAIILSVLVCSAVAWLHVQERQTLRQTMGDFNAVRQAQLDLAKGFMHISLADEQSAPFSKADGEVLLKQSAASFEEALARIDGVDKELARNFQADVNTFLSRLAAWKASDAGHDGEQMVALRVAFNELERQAAQLDRQLRRHMQAHSDHLSLQFDATLGLAAILLAVICAVVAHVGRTSDRFEAASHESSERFRLAMEATKDGLWDLNVETGAVYYSPGYWRMLGYTDEEHAAVVESWSELLHPDDHDRVRALSQTCFEKRSGVFEAEFRLKAKNGAWRWILSRGTVVERNSKGAAARMIGTHVDISDYKQAEAALRDSEEQFRAIFQVVSVGIVQVVPETGQILRFNEKYREITGYPPEELDALKFPELTHPDDRARDWALFADAVCGKTPGYSNEKRYIRKDGSTIWVRLNASFIRDAEGTPIRSVAICEDVTARRRAEEERERLQVQLAQAQKMESVGRLAGGIAHDFNNILGVIIGRSDLAKEKLGPDHPLADDIDEIHKASERAANLTRQLLAFARKQTVAPKVLDLNETVAGMLKMLGRLIGEDIDLAWMPRPELWPVKVDSAQIDQILANLCVNARDAIDGVGKVTIETGNIVFDASYCSDHAGHLPGEYVMLAVSDNGCGMDKSIQARIFEPFFTTKGVGKGSGLGLPTVFGIVKQNSGFINVYSEPGKGSTFKIYLPRHLGDPAAEHLPTGNTPAQCGRGETVLLVEDDLSLLKLSSIMLSREGYTILAAHSPELAIRQAREFPGEIDLLMTDVIMPDMNGRELEARIRQFRPSLKSLFMSGYTANVIAHHGVLDASVQFIQKPFSRQALAEKVRQVLDAPRSAARETAC